MILHVSDHTQITIAMTNSQSEIFYQLTSICGLPTSSAICEQTVMNFTYTAHGFCAEWSHLDDPRADFEISTWFGSSSHFLNMKIQDFGMVDFQCGRYTVKLISKE